MVLVIPSSSYVDSLSCVQPFNAQYLHKNNVMCRPPGFQSSPYSRFKYHTPGRNDASSAFRIQAYSLNSPRRFKRWETPHVPFVCIFTWKYSCKYVRRGKMLHWPSQAKSLLRKSFLPIFLRPSITKWSNHTDLTSWKNWSSRSTLIPVLLAPLTRSNKRRG